MSRGSRLTSPNIGDARRFAQSYANEDGFPWAIWFCEKSRRYTYNNNQAYFIADENEDPGSNYKKIETVRPRPKKASVEPDPRGEPVYLTEEEKQVVAAVLHPDEIGREYFPGSEEVKTRLRFKLLGLELRVAEKKKEITA